jgi:hypothetical protein
VICLDELGPVAARSYPSPSWSDGAHRPQFPPRYARHGYRWAFGALAHRTGTLRFWSLLPFVPHRSGAYTNTLEIAQFDGPK